jgi:hypothetical protein
MYIIFVVIFTIILVVLMNMVLKGFKKTKK